ncbi:MAG: hypothetical protein AAGF59_10755 [Pseudomonadota bacterium]
MAPKADDTSRQFEKIFQERPWLRRENLSEVLSGSPGPDLRVLQRYLSGGIGHRDSSRKLALEHSRHAHSISFWDGAEKVAQTTFFCAAGVLMTNVFAAGVANVANAANGARNIAGLAEFISTSAKAATTMQVINANLAAQAIIFGTGVAGNNLVFGSNRFPSAGEASFKFLLTLVCALAGRISLPTSGGNAVQLLGPEGVAHLQLGRMMAFDMIVFGRDAQARIKISDAKRMTPQEVGQKLGHVRNSAQASVADLAGRLAANLHDQIFGRDYRVALDSELAAEFEKIAPKVNWATEAIAYWKAMHKNDSGRPSIEKDLEYHVEQSIKFTIEDQIMSVYCFILFRIGLASKTLSFLVSKVTVEDILREQETIFNEKKQAGAA